MVNITAKSVLNELNTKWRRKYPQLVMLEFSDWKPWRQRNTLDYIDEIGTYVLAKNKVREKEHSVLDQLDEQVIYIGETKKGKTTSLRKRLNDFNKAACGSSGHAGGSTYYDKFGSDLDDVFVSICPMYIEEGHNKLTEIFEHESLNSLNDFLLFSIPYRLELCLRGLYVFKWGMLPICNKE